MTVIQNLLRSLQRWFEKQGFKSLGDNCATGDWEIWSSGETEKTRLWCEYATHLLLTHLGHTESKIFSLVEGAQRASTPAK